MTPRSGLGQSPSLIGYSSELREIAEARQFTTVVRSLSLQINNPHFRPLFPYTSLRTSTLIALFLKSSVTGLRVNQQMQRKVLALKLAQRFKYNMLLCCQNQEQF